MSAPVPGFDPSQHPGRQCSRDCAEYGCARWTPIDPITLLQHLVLARPRSPAVQPAPITSRRRLGKN